jgi:hypothetical protein
MKHPVFQIQQGKHKGKYVVKTRYEMPVKIFVRGLKPIPFISLVGYDRDGKIQFSKRIPYEEFKVNKNFLQEVGAVEAPKYLADPNGMPDKGINGFYLLDKYSGKTQEQVKELARAEKPLVDYSKMIQFI